MTQQAIALLGIYSPREMKTYVHTIHNSKTIPKGYIFLYITFPNDKITGIENRLVAARV